NTTIVPGSNKAILTLGNGQKISLTDAGNGQIAKQAGITITKQADGQLLYTIDEARPGDEISFNTIETPRGGQYQVALPDGSKVWLNAATALRFPTRFSATERTVYLDGEAYFEIAHNSKSPFRVSVNGQQVEVLGTHFNIMAYKDEQTVRTTLLEGAVKLTAPVGSILLKPGQQGYIVKEKNAYNSAYVDVTMVTAWKDGLFKFDGIDMRTLMRQISRWYDVEVIYEPGVKDDVVFGSISRKSDLTRLLRILELGGVHFRVESRKLIVMP
ncbi:MAG TPA: FecR domain-containing protein, partial [Niastella sp.]